MTHIQSDIEREAVKGYPQLCYIHKSSDGKHKYDALITTGYRRYKIIRFGAIRTNGRPYEQFKDRLGYYSEYDHLNEKRRALYYKRHKKDYPKYSADGWPYAAREGLRPLHWFSKEYLW